jgi:DNA-binding Xre family transcriptional regulator
MSREIFIFLKKNFTNTENNYIYTYRENYMGISYRPLWILLASKELKKTDLMELVKLSPATIAKLSKNQPVDGKILQRLCEYFDCQPGEIMEYVKSIPEAGDK